MSRTVLLLIVSLAVTTTGSAATCFQVSDWDTTMTTDWLLNEPMEFPVQPKLPAIQRENGALLADQGIAIDGVEVRPAVLRINTHNLMQYDARLVEMVTRIV